MNPIQKEQLNTWSARYQQSEIRQLATLALSKAGVNSASYLPKAAFAMRQPLARWPARDGRVCLGKQPETFCGNHEDGGNSA